MTAPRLASLFLLGLLFCIRPAQVAAHPADVTHLRVLVEPHRVEVRLTFNLLTLTRFIPIDADASGTITAEEILAARDAIGTWLDSAVPFSINGREDLSLDPIASIRPVWAVAKAPDIAAEDYAQRWVDVVASWTSPSLVKDVWIGFEIFETTGYQHTVQGWFETAQDRLEVPFTVSEPEFLFDTAFPADPAPEPPPAVPPPPPRESTRWSIGSLALAGLLVLALVGLARKRQRKRN
ncbi:MAG: hypothetical protein KDK99_13835 [Verrucomicrobiales bacterium]|nr:hypothetical protein [Verrucomicrobiales bacterium]